MAYDVVEDTRTRTALWTIFVDLSPTMNRLNISNEEEK